MTSKTNIVGSPELKRADLVLFDFGTNERIEVNMMLGNWNICDCGIVVGSKTAGSTSTPKVWDRNSGLRDLANAIKLPVAKKEGAEAASIARGSNAALVEPL